MRINLLKECLKTAAHAATVLLLGAGLASAQQSVNLTAGASTTALPDGSAVPMWGYGCGTAVSGSTATCAALNATAGAGWSPVVITVPTGQGLAITLTNSLPVPTSIVIVGQVGGGLGDVTQRTTTSPPDHSGAQSSVTWPIVGSGSGTPPMQGPRVQSFATEVAAGSTTTAALTWSSLQPGTYLLESGTHPSIQGPMGLYGILVVTTPPSGTTAGTAYGTAGTSSAVSYNADIPLLFSEIDPVQNNAVAVAVQNPMFSETRVWSGLPTDPTGNPGCGNPASGALYQSCYPPAVNYTPLYYLINGVAFNKTSARASQFNATAGVDTSGNPVFTGITGTVLVRMVNAGLRMHVPSIVGSQTGTAVAPATVPPAGFSLIAEDGNPLPGTPRLQSEVFMAAGKTYDVMINAANVPPVTTALPIYDRELSLSANKIGRDSGMLAYISVNGAGLPTDPGLGAAVARGDTYNSVIPGQSFSVSDPGKGVIANDTNVFGVQVLAGPTGGTLVLNADGTFTYTANTGTTADSFTYCANGSVTGTTCSSGVTASVTLGACTTASGCQEAGTGIAMGNITYTSNLATYLKIAPSGILSVDKDGAGYPLTVDTTTVAASSGLTVKVDLNGGFVATVGASGTYTFTYKAKNSQGTQSANAATVTLVFPAASNLAVTVLDGSNKTTQITDYRWLIEEDRTFYVDPNCTTNPPPAGCPTAGEGIVPTFGTNFHTSYMPLVATGCTDVLSCESGQSVQGAAAVCDVGNGVCRTDASEEAQILPSSVHLDPTKRYYLTIFPGDAAASFENTGSCLQNNPPVCGHGMGGAPIAFGQTSVTVYTQPNPYPPAKLSVFVFEDDFPLNGEQDAGGGIDVLATNEPGLGGFNITLFDDAGGTGDATGQMTYDMFNQPLSNSLAGTIDPATGFDSCPITGGFTSGGNNVSIARLGVDSSNGNATGATSPTGITGTIVTCPRFEADGHTLSPLAGQAIIANLMPGRYGVVATPGADRIARGEEWLQTNTLDGQKAHDSFLRIGEPNFFQEFGPAGYHVTIGFANPNIINARKAGVCNGTDPNLPNQVNCTHTVTGKVTTERMSRTPDERLYSSGSNDSFAFTQCYVSLGDTDGEDFAFTKCAADGTFTLSGIPNGDWRITVFDQWNDMLVDGLSTPVGLGPGYGLCTGSGSSATLCNLGDIAMNQWQANIYTKTFFDRNGNGTQDSNEDGLTLVATNIRFRDGSYSNFNNTDLEGNAGFNEVFPLFSWYVVETDSTRYKSTGIHVVYDSGGPADGTPGGGTSNIGQYMANTLEPIPLPAALRVPGAYYCSSADCTDAPAPYQNTSTASSPGGTTGRIDPPWVNFEGWQGFSGQNSFLEFGKKPFVVGETGGIHGEVIYASTRPFDDPSLLIHTSWTPDVPGVTINLYQEGTAPDGSTSLKLVDTTKTSSWDDWAQGFRSDGNPNMNCPGQGAATGTNADLFFFSLFNQPMYLDFYNNVQHGTASAPSPLPNNSQFKCYDGMHNWNQLQPAPYDGYYTFPSVTAMDPATGLPTATNCTICVTNPDSGDKFRYGGSTTSTPWVAGTSPGTPMLPAGKYVVEMIVPPGYELVKEEDKNILIGDNYIAPVTQQFGALGDIYILPDQAQIGSEFNPNNPQNSTQNLGRNNYPQGEGDTGSVEQFWPCVGAMRIVPDFISLFPQSGEVSPFAGAMRPLCDRKEVTLQDQQSALAKFWIFTSAHAAAHFTGVITDDFTSEFDPFSPQFGEKFSPPDMPVAIKDWSGTEISRVYADHWGTYDGLTYSTWEVNPPNPTGYAPTMMVTCMNDPGSGPTPDPLYNPQYSDFCYEIPFMPGQTQYMDTPVVPTSAFAGAGYNNPDCNYPNLTPAIKEVDGDGVGPWVSAAGHTLTITALGDQNVPNNAYSGPSANMPPFNQKTILRHYGFGATAGVVALRDSNGNLYPLTSVSWNDTTITGTVPTGVPLCSIQQESQYGGPGSGTTPANGVGFESCGQLVITTSTGQQSIDAVTVTIGGKSPTHVASTDSVQAAIDNAKPGDLLIIDPTCTNAGATAACSTTGATKAGAAVHQEILLMWKPLRLQGVGAVSSVIDANTQPAGKLNPWRAKVNCLFGLAVNGQPASNGHDVPKPDPTQGDQPANPFDPSGTYTCGGWTAYTGGDNNPQVDRLPLEAVVGWDTTLNGNLAELLQEPSLMGAYEGAGITVLAKGVRYPSGVEVFGTGPDTTAGANIAHEGQMPLGTVLLTNSAADCTYSSNFQCSPSRIDGLSITDSSQGGGGIFAHAWTHNLEIANNRIYNNTGTLSGGINIGQGESPDALLVGNGGDPLAPTGGLDQQPWTCVRNALNANGSQNPNPAGYSTNDELPFCYNVFVNLHNNYVTQNSSIGDEVFSGTPAGAGGVTFCSGSDYYKFNYNWVCGNISTGDGGGLAQLGFSYKGDIEHNSILFNQSTNPTIATNGGGIIIMGGAPDGTAVAGNAATPECGSVTDIDCAPGLSDGTGPGLVINANLIEGNGAESGSGGGIRLQDVDGAELAFFPNGNALVTRGDAVLGFTNIRSTSGPATTYNTPWYAINVYNNIINNNVAGWDGGGVSLQDALAVNFINNTVASNDSTASSGVLFNTLGAPDASAPGSNCTNAAGTASCPQPAGFVTMRNNSLLTASLPATGFACPTNHGTTGNTGNCRNFSVPLLDNDVFWQNRSFDIGVGALGTGTLNQQKVVSLFNGITNTAAPSQPGTDSTVAQGGGVLITGGTGACVTSGASAPTYWDLGVRGDSGPANHSGGLTLSPTFSVITVTTANGYTGTGNTAGALDAISQYCDGARVPPENGGLGYQVPPGIADATVPNPIFNLTPSATVDEGNNWINISWGPLALTNTSGGSLNGATLGNYGPTTGSSVINRVPAAGNSGATGAFTLAPATDFYGNLRKTNNFVDSGAVEFLAGGAGAPIASVTVGPLHFGTIAVNTTSAAQTLTLHNTGTANLTGIAITFTGPYSRAGGTCTATLAPGTCTITVVFHPTASGEEDGTATITAIGVTVTGSPVTLTGAGAFASATLTPTSHSYGSHVRNCPTPAVACALDPVQTFTLTNTGNVTLTGIAQGVLGGTNAADFFVNRLLSTCGPTGNGQLLGRTTLAAGATCVVTVQFRPLTSEGAGVKNATISVTDAAGTQTSTLTGTAQ